MDYETRIGFGWDVHKLASHDESKPPGKRHITLCGVHIKHDHYLVGHSDADIGIHALVDAILGALAEGDIGEHFPPNDPQFRGADSSRFLIQADAMLKKRGGHIVNIDVTLICEKPRIKDHRDAMRNRLAEILSIDIARVSVKGSTSEKMGYVGRGDGMVAHAAVSLALPKEAGND